MSEVNRHGLSRNIPKPVQLEVRQRCGFGCVVCGKAIYHYEHIDPEFADARAHDPSCITLLCGSCHDKGTRGILSKETIKQRNANPKCREVGFSFEAFDISTQPVEVILGTVVARNVRTLIRICGDDVFSIFPPQEDGQPFLINASFYDENGKPILWIKENEWRSSSNNWDVRVIGKHIKVRKAFGNLALVIRTEPPHRLVIERMNMVHKGKKIYCKEGKSFEASTSRTKFISRSAEFDGCLVAIDVHDCGIMLGRGGGAMTIFDATLSSGNLRHRR